MTVCSMNGCKVRSGHNIKMFSFPRDLKWKEIWSLACQRSDKRPGIEIRGYICAKHFSEDQFERNLMFELTKRIGKTHRGLKLDAVPDQNLPTPVISPLPQALGSIKQFRQPLSSANWLPKLPGTSSSQQGKKQDMTRVTGILNQEKAEYSTKFNLQKSCLAAPELDLDLMKKIKALVPELPFFSDLDFLLEDSATTKNKDQDENDAAKFGNVLKPLWKPAESSDTENIESLQAFLPQQQIAESSKVNASETMSELDDKNNPKIRMCHQCPECQKRYQKLPRHLVNVHQWSRKLAAKAVNNLGLRKSRNSGIPGRVRRACPVVDCRSNVLKLGQHLIQCHNMCKTTKKYKDILKASKDKNNAEVFSL